jgi:energy-coupling factor transport system ATP-binding protein
VVVLCRGSIVLQGTPEQVFAHGDQLVALGLEEPFDARLAEALRERGLAVPWTIDADGLATSIVSLVPKDATGAETNDDGSNPIATAPSATSIAAEALGYSYGDTDAREARRTALEQVSFRIPEGSYTAIVGQTGSGKSTLLRLLCALEAPDEGRLVVDGIDTSDRRQRRLLHGRVGYVMQHPERQLFAETVWDDVAYGPTNLGLSAAEVEQRCHDALALVGLTGREQSSPFHLSGGLQRLCALAGILAMEPHILVLDEPTAGLDPRGRAQLRTIIGRIHERGTTVMQVTHSMDDAALAEQVIVLDEGTVLMQGTPQEVFRPETAQTLRSCGLGLSHALNWALRLEQEGVRGLGRPLTLDALAAHIVAVAKPPEGQEVRHGL